MKLRIGTRKSRLALAQAGEVADRLARLGVEAELVPIVTSGDRGATAEASAAGLKGLFVAEIVRALRDGGVDLAVHSAKDLPAEDDEDLALAAVPERASPLDVLVTRDGELRPGSAVGTSSLRRRAQIVRWRPDVLLKDLRGNVDTRLKKLDDGKVDALVLAAAGLMRLGIAPEHAAPMSVAEMVPAPGQGCLALQARADDPATCGALSALDHADSHAALDAERGVMARLGGGCALPLGVYAEVRNGRVHVEAVVISPDGADLVRASVEDADPKAAAAAAAETLLGHGAGRILDAVRGA